MSNWQIDSKEEIEKIVSRTQSGDVESFRLLVEKFQAEIFRMIIQQVGEYSVAEDLTQETFLKAFKYIKKFRAESSFKTWITRIALNTTNTYFSSRLYRRRALQVPLDLKSHDLSSESYDMETEQKIRLVRKALGQLKVKYRSVVALCILQQKSYQEAADILGIPMGTVGSRLNTAIAMLNEHLGSLANESL